MQTIDRNLDSVVAVLMLTLAILVGVTAYLDIIAPPPPKNSAYRDVGYGIMFEYPIASSQD